MVGRIWGSGITRGQHVDKRYFSIIYGESSCLAVVSPKQNTDSKHFGFKLWALRFTV